MIDLLIKDERGIPLATAMTNDRIDSKNLRVINIDPLYNIVLGRDYTVGEDNNTHMMRRTCVALSGNVGTFAI